MLHDPPRRSHLWRSRHLPLLFWKSGYGPDKAPLFLRVGLQRVEKVHGYVCVAQILSITSLNGYNMIGVVEATEPYSTVQYLKMSHFLVRGFIY